MPNYEGKHVYTVDRTDVRKNGFTQFYRAGQGIKSAWRSVVDLCGRFTPNDVGKQIWETSEGVLQIESDEQMRRRLDEERGVRKKEANG